ncbi:DUF4011 domain-containing protein [Silvanigrella aquatica]|uniref:Restriction endonuclease type II-like domain-containing protein n=1 Tax=Silvanigrella aquatica TaxID=1915309 RepID=A0A1L4CY44_9BACT|nr:DUF4011 domain-containing protein [Silvanigrella aquatica]APJ02881.1 hypothetical protein AXG55_02670 [Silvanigrella aquatica]
MNNIQLKRQLLKYRDSLEGFTPKNSSLFYKHNVSTTINLTIDDNENVDISKNDSPINRHLRWISKEFEQIFIAKKFDLNSYLLIEKKLNSNLFQKLEKLTYISESYERKFGNSCLYLLGPFLSWQSNCNKTNAPIFKIPVYLNKNSKDQYHLYFHKETITFNEVLLHYLEYFFNIKFDSDKEFHSVNYAFHYFTEILRNHGIFFQYLNYKYEFKDDYVDNQFLIYDFMNIDILENENLSLYKDYNEIVKLNDASNILHDLLKKEDLNHVEKNENRAVYPDTKDELKYFIYKNELRNILDIAKNERSVVLSLPIGVQKNDILCDIILNAVIQNKKVLFVSENKNYLDSLYQKMLMHSLNKNIIIVNDNQLNKDEIFSDILKFNDEKSNYNLDDDFLKVIYDNEKIKININNFYSMTQEKHLKSGLKNVEIIHKALNVKKELSDENIFKKFGHIEWEKLSQILAEIDGIQYFYSRLDNSLDSPWIYKHTETTKTKELFNVLLEIKNNITQLNCEKKYLNYKISQFQPFNDSLDYLNEYAVFINRNNLDLEISYDYKEIWEKNISWPSDLINYSNQIKLLILEMDLNKKGYLAIKLNTDPTLVLELEKYFSLPHNFTKFFSKKYWSMCMMVKNICPTWDGSLQPFIQFQNYLNAFEKLSSLVADISAKSINDPSNPNHVIEIANKIQIDLEKIFQIFYDASMILIPNHFNEATNSYYSYKNVMQIIRNIADTVKNREECDFKIDEYWNRLNNFIDINRLKISHVEKKIALIGVLIDRIDDIDFIHQYNNIINKIKDKFDIINLDLNIIESLSHHQGKWKDIVFSSVIVGWFGEIIADYPSIRNFGKMLFSYYDNEIIKNYAYYNRNKYIYCQNEISKNYPDLTDNKIFKELSNQFLNYFSIGNPNHFNDDEFTLFQKIMPLWMMTPHSASRFLPLKQELFDLVIFDNFPIHSMNKAIPLIYRAQQIFIIKEAHHSSISSSKDDNSRSSDNIDKIIFKNSLQYEFKNTSCHLNEALLAFYNVALCKGDLYFAQRPMVFLSESQIQYIQINTDWKNKTEVIGNHFLNLMESNPHQSFAIVTISIEQSLKYNDYLTRVIQINEFIPWSIQGFTYVNQQNPHVKICIQDIENMTFEQFDNVIFIIDSHDSLLIKSKLFENDNINFFIAKIISIVKDKFYIFSSFPLNDFDTSEKAYVDNYYMCLLGRLLKYSKVLSEDNIDAAFSILKSFKGNNKLFSNKKVNEFSNYVKLELENLGYKVSESIGFHHVCIDLAIHHPFKKNQYILGIICDEGFLSSNEKLSDTTLDIQVLTKLGWNIEKLYSIDWLKDPLAELNNIHLILQKIMQIERGNIVEYNELNAII